MPKIFIETNRLILREMTLEDKEGMFEMDSDPEVHRYLGNSPLTSIDEVPAVIQHVRQQYEELGIGRWSVIEKQTNLFVGWSGLKLITELTYGRKDFYDLGYRFMRSAWGKGFATESALAVRDYAFNEINLDRLYAVAEVEHTASNKVLKKIGFKFQREFPEYDGTTLNDYLLTKQDFILM